MEKNSKIYVAGHNGLLGSSIVRILKKEGFNNLLFKTKSELDLREQKLVRYFFNKEKPDYVFLAAAKVGGLQANNTYKADFIYDNLQIQSNIIDSAFRAKTKKLLFIASNCMYPKNCGQPFKEEQILTGKLEPTNEPFAIAKIAGIKMCEAYNFQHKTNFISIIPASIYGPWDNYIDGESHIVPDLIKKLYNAKISGLKKIIISGNSKRKREMIYVDDVANACLFLMKNYSSSKPINAGYGEDFTVEEIAEKIKKIVGFEGEIEFDGSKPSGMIRKILGSSRITSLGWKPQINFEEGLKKSYSWFLNNVFK